MSQLPSPGKSALSFYQRVYLWFENLILEKLVPSHDVGPIFHWIFKFPLLLDNLHLDFLIPNGILILTTVGRRSGKLRSTPMEYGKVQPDGSYIVMSGWAGRTDWYQNALAHPKVKVKVGRLEFPATAESLNTEQTAVLLKEIIQTNPASIRFFARWSGPIDPSSEGLASAARFFPSLKIQPIIDSAKNIN